MKKIGNQRSQIFWKFCSRKFATNFLQQVSLSTAPRDKNVIEKEISMLEKQLLSI